MTSVTLFVFCLLILAVIGYSYNINFIVIKDIINSDNEPTLICGPDPVDYDCFNPQFTHNSTAIDTTSTKYTLRLDTNTVRSNLIVHSITPSDAGNYRCRYSCDGQNVYSPSLTLRFVPPVVFLVANNITYHQYVGSNVTFLCNALHFTLLQWQDSNGDTIQQNDKYLLQEYNLTIINVTTDDQSTYFCAASNQIIVRVAITAILKVYMKPTTTAVSNESVTVFEGNTTSFTCTATAIPQPHIIWSNDNDLTIGGRIQKVEENVDQYTVRSTLTITGVLASDGGKYKCAGGNDNGTSTLIFSLSVIIPPTPGIYVNLRNINSTSVKISWVITGISKGAIVTIRWRISEILNGSIHEINVTQDSSPLIISLLEPNTSYTFTANVSSLSNSMMIKTFPEELYYTSSQMRDISSPSLMLGISSSYVFIKQSSNDFFNLSSSSTFVILSSVTQFASLSLVISATPTVVEISRNVNLGVSIGAALGVTVIAIMIVFILSIGVWFTKRKKNKKVLNIQSIDKQNSIRSDSQLLGDSKGYPTRMSGVSLNSLHGPLSPSHNGDFHEMTVNPHFAGHATLSQDSVSVYNTCSSCPPLPGKVHENIYHIESYGCEEFEMTDNPYYECNDIPTTHKYRGGGHVHIDPYSTSTRWNGSESASQIHRSPKEDNGFEFNDNSNYEPCPNLKSPAPSIVQFPPPYPVYSSDMSLSRTQSPRFQIVSDKRGDVREKVNLVN